MNRVVLSITNKCESEVNITLVSNETDEDFKILFQNETVAIDRQDTKSPCAVLRQNDNPSFVCYRKDNKIAVFCDIIPLRDDRDVQVSCLTCSNFFLVAIVSSAQSYVLSVCLKLNTVIMA
jgi:hypothetical protein